MRGWTRGREATRHRDAVPLRVHALLVRHVVTALRFVTGVACSACSREGAAQQAYARPDYGTRRVAADRRAGGRAHHRTNCRARNATAFLRARCRLTADLVISILSATAVIKTKLIEAPAGAGQHHDARTHGDADAS